MVTSWASRAGDAAIARAPSVVARPDLFARLSAAAAAGNVLLVSAAAGSGKTILLRSWIDAAQITPRVGWVSVERGERDAQRFWLSVVHSLRAIPGVDAVVENLTPTPEFGGAALIGRLASQLGSLEQPVVLVIDDLHELHSDEAFEQLEALIARRPPPLRIVLASRHDPRLGLHRLRVAEQLTEIRAADLRFSVEQARQLLARSGLTLTEQSISALHVRTEGWAAGLRLAALSLTTHPDPERFVQEFAGSERTVADYLLAEVLEHQPEDVRRLLLRTSILDQVNGPLADILVGASGSERILQALEDANAFVVSLDPGRAWFRYHHLFADLLRLELRRTEPEHAVRLHRLAADWYADQGDVVQAVRHAQAAEDWSRAAQLLVDNSLTLSLRGQDATIAALITTFPRGATPTSELALLFGYREMTRGSLDAAAAYLAVAERHSAGLAHDRKHRFDIVLAVMRLSLARRRGDFGTVLARVQALLESADAQTLSEVGLSADARAKALMNLGIVELWAFRRDEAVRHLEQALELARPIGLVYVEIGCLSHLAVIDVWRSFGQARQRCAQAISLAEAHGLSAHPIVCAALAMMGLMEVSQARFDIGQVWLDRAETTLRADLEPATALLVRRAQGMLQFGVGRLEEALATFRDAEQLQSMLVTPHALTAQMREFLILTLLRLGQTAEARKILSELSDEERHWGEARTALASVRLAEGDMQAAADAVEALGPVLDGSAPLLHSGSLVEALLARAAARDRLGDHRAAEDDIEHALEVAEPDAQMFPFVLIRPADLLQGHPRQRTAHAALLSDILDVLAGSPLRPRIGEDVRPREDLSGSELRVLGFLPSNLSASEIAAELVVSTSTVKTHMRQIYTKLDVHKRSEAVERARELGLLGRASRGQRH